MYEQLRKKVYEILYPEGIPLEFGCEVKLQGLYIRPVWQIEYNENDEVERIFTESSNIGMYQYSSKDTFEILGKPLSLQDILIVLSKKQIITSCGQSENIAIDTNGNFIVPACEAYGCGLKKEIKLDLSKQISEQSEETLKALLELIS